MIAMQSTDRRAPVPPDPLASPQGPLEHRHNLEEGAPAAPYRFQHLLARLEEGYEFHTMQLAQLGAQPADSAHAFDRHSLEAASRQALTGIAAALRAMAEGRYGICASCAQPIPLERLEARPEARHCVRCQASATG